jgi:hypothetical protein
MTPRIVAMGGGGFSMEDDPRLDDFVLVLGLAAHGAGRVAIGGSARSLMSDTIL